MEGAQPTSRSKSITDLQQLKEVPDRSNSNQPLDDVVLGIPSLGLEDSAETAQNGNSS